ncbi:MULTISPECIES: PLP-dependent aminotransferase family protein [Metabacillus]|uniref:Aminotransferase n=2 Tax=Metabacillus TaxID=2675233 RepID=A0A179SLG2_9BACI|nr:MULTISPECIES: PLP-dependent aminotransferase family protein [Metabacillus]OAS82525.1 aminotransferase [Metabacillus litoralis]QNF26710.1 PLP-dependent aminotransferase family protein [Metabacillus sp. KUDC1714]
MNYSFAEQTKNFKSSAVRDILAVIQQGNVISFAGGLPSEESFPLREVQIAYEKVFSSGKSSLQYGLTEGYKPLREAIKTKMEGKGVVTPLENMLITTGSQQAIDLFSRVILSTGDVVLTEDPTYLSALQVFRSYGANVVAVNSDEHGMEFADLEAKVKTYQPKFIYIIPTFSNPEGKAWSIERRQQLLELCYKYDVLVLEDDPYGDIKFHDEEEYPTVASFDHGQSHVVYTSTFSKSVVPALRTGWVTGPSPIIKMMTQAKQMADLHSSSIDQQALYFLLRDFNLEGHIQHLRSEYYHRMTIMRDYLNKLEPGVFTWKEPKGGMFLWVEGQEHLNTPTLLKSAVEKGVAFVPGAPFYVDKPKYNTFRLNFSHSTPEKIKLGMDRLVDVLLSPITI